MIESEVSLLRRVKNFFVNVLAFVSALLFLIVSIALILFNSVLAFALGYFVAWILQLLGFADVISDGLNLVFNTARFTEDNLTLVLGTFGLLAAFFKPKLAKDKSES